MKRSPPPRRRKPLRAKPRARAAIVPLRRTRIKGRSASRAAEDGRWRDVKLLVAARDGDRCLAEPLVPEVACGGRLDPHHVWPTGTGGPRLDPANIITCCRAHHDWVHHEHPREARRRGLLR